MRMYHIQFFTKFRMAKSQGSFFNKEVSRKFTYNKIEKDG